MNVKIINSYESREASYVINLRPKKAFTKQPDF